MIEGMIERYIHTAMNDRLMMDEYFCLYYTVMRTDRLCCNIASLHLAYVLRQQLFIQPSSASDKIYELQLTPHYYKPN